MTTQLPDRAEIDSACKLIDDNCQSIYTWRYERERPQLVTLYEKAAHSQWVGSTDLDWSTDVDPESLVDLEAPNLRLMREVTRMPGSPIASWGDAELRALGIEMFTALLSQFMHGEQGAMMTAAKIVDTVPWIDAKYYAATQTMDEARHTEVFARYIDEKVGDAYPMNPHLEAQITGLLEDSRWDIAYLGMQIVIESLALSAFGDMARRTREPLLRKLLRYVMADEARHVAFGILSLGEYYEHLSSAELKDRQDFLLEHTVHARARSTTPEVWERMGVPVGGRRALHHRGGVVDGDVALPGLPERVLLQAGAERAAARPARRQRRVPAGAVGGSRTAGVRVRRGHRGRLRQLRRGGRRPGQRRGLTARHRRDVGPWIPWPHRRRGETHGP